MLKHLLDFGVCSLLNESCHVHLAEPQLCALWTDVQLPSNTFSYA